MGTQLHDLVRHNVWATSEILAACDALSSDELDATVPGTYGSVIATLGHLIDAEAGYFFRMQVWDEVPWTRGVAASLADMRSRAALLSEQWDAFLSAEFDAERVGEAKGPGATFAVRNGVFLTQALHHANEHRAHICTIIGALGKEVPDVSAWGYAIATGRSWTIEHGSTG